MADINRADAEGLLRDQDINEILQDAREGSAALRTFKTISMGTKTARMPVLSALPSAGFVSETGTKETSEVAWVNKELVAEEIAVIVPIHENVFDDSRFNVWAEVRPLIAEELGRIIDAAVFFGENKPASWDASLYDGAVAAGQVVGDGDHIDLAEDINQTWGMVEANGYDVNVQYASRRIRVRLRGLRDDNNAPIYLESLRSDGADRSLMGEQIEFVTNGAWAGDNEEFVTLLAGDRTKAIIGIRQDVTYKILTEATVGGINLAERDMIALRAKMRLAFAVADPLKRDTADGTPSRTWPFAALGASS